MRQVKVISWTRLVKVLGPVAAWPTCTIFYAMAMNRLSNSWIPSKLPFCLLLLLLGYRLGFLVLLPHRVFAEWKCLPSNQHLTGRGRPVQRKRISCLL
jgi:hypothetical protein